ncbi:MAG: hypothetical protein LBN20_00705 [Endomicrobium sp.]|jgi:hypothetical protein|nr:hypothetical protein [Endomicrobium sp.]
MISLPFVQGYMAGNLVILSAVFSAFFLMNYKNENKTMRELAFISLAIAGALKISPGFFGILLLYEKRYKDALKTIIYFLILAFLPFFYFTQEHSVIENISKFISESSSHNTWPSYPFMFPESIINRDTNVYVKIKTFLVYPLAAIGIIAGYFQKVQWKQTALLLCLSILMFSANLHMNMYFFLIIAMFLNENHKTINFSKDNRFETIKNIWYLLAFILLLNPYQFPSYYGASTSWWIVKGAFWMLFFALFAETLHSFYSQVICKKTEAL